MAAVKKKKAPGFHKGPVPGAAKKKKAPGKRYSSVDYVAVGGDVSTYSISLAAIARTHDGKVRTGAVSLRWEKTTDYFGRIADAANVKELVYELFTATRVMPNLGDVYFAVEEPISYGHLERKESQTIKQQCQISGAFLGGLLKWGWTNIFEIQANSWRKVVADDLAEKFNADFTIHVSKYNNPDLLPLPKDWHVSPKSIGKYRSQQWLHEIHPSWDGHWPDIISHSTRGHIPRPVESHAAGMQPDDRYDAYPMAAWMRREIKRGKQ